MKNSKYVYIAVDFDGTITKWNSFPMTGYADTIVIDFLKFLKTLPNVKLALWTCRHGKQLQEAIDFCKNLDVTFDVVNDDFIEIKELGWGEGRKIYADYYIDDKAVMCKSELYKLIQRLEQKLGKKKNKKKQDLSYANVCKK